MDCGSAQITLRVFYPGRLRVASREAQEDGLKHVFGIMGVARHPIGDPEDEGVVGVEGAFERQRFPRARAMRRGWRLLR